jgi:hypothetical protein
MASSLARAVPVPMCPETLACLLNDRSFCALDGQERARILQHRDIEAGPSVTGNGPNTEPSPITVLVNWQPRRQ